MKYFFLFLLIACASEVQLNPIASIPEEISIVRLKPIKYSSKPSFGVLTAELYNEKNELIRSDSAPWGDCRECVRGFSVLELIGFRVEGKGVKDASIAHKADPSVKILKCHENQFVNTQYSCTFALKKYYEMRLRLEK